MKVSHNPLQLFSVRETAKLLNLSEHCVWRLIKQRRLPVTKIQQRVMMSSTAIARFIKKNTFRVFDGDGTRSDIVFRS
jgi:excisionase family DNA binding protein